MSKLEILLLCILFIASCIFSFVRPDETIEEKNQEKIIVVHVEGIVDEQLTFSDNPTIKDVFQKLKIKNIYGFDDQYTLASQEYFYIPLNNDLISINHASLEELTTIKGIGEKTAQKIIDYRNQTPFQTIEEIQNIHGIGEKTYRKIREYLCL